MDSRTYWIKRSEQEIKNLVEVPPDIPKTKEVMEKAERIILDRIDSIIRNAQKKKKYPELLMTKIAFAPDVKEMEAKFKELRKQGINVPKDLKPYLYRMTVQGLIYKTIDYALIALANRFTFRLRDALKWASLYTHQEVIKKLKKTGVSPEFTHIDPSEVNMILNYKWSGEHFSHRIWKQAHALNYVLKQELAAGFLSGDSLPRIAKRIRDRFKVTRYQAMRLVRTEANYVHSQTELYALAKEGYKEYEYWAKLDSRTSHICKSMHKKKFKFSEAKPGVNLPPLHPNCRSTIRPVFEKQEIEWTPEKIKRLQQKFMPKEHQMTEAEYEQLESETIDRMLRDEKPKTLNVYQPTKTKVKVGGHEVELSELETEIAKRMGVKFAIEKRPPNVYGTFLMNRKLLAISPKVIKIKPKYFKQVFFHEVGHMIDAFLNRIKDQRVLQPKPVGRAITDSKLLASDNVRLIFEKRIPREEVAKVMRKAAENLQQLGVELGAQTEEDKKRNLLEFEQKLKQFILKTSTAQTRRAGYHGLPAEMFAEIYSMFRTNPQWVKRNAPKLYEYLKRELDRLLEGLTNHK